MPTVRVKELFAKPWREVLHMVGEFERYPDWIPDVASVRIVERGDGWAVSAWETRLGGTLIRWTERDEWILEENRGRIVYRQVDGDLKRMSGHWEVVAEGPEEASVEFFCDFEIGLPGLSAVLHPVAALKLKQRMTELLRELRSRTEVTGSGVPVRLFDSSF